MKNAFSTKWISSKQPRKQRKYRIKAPLHVKQNLLGSHLAKDLREKHGTRSIPVIKGDKVKVLRGQFKEKKGKVERVDLKALKVFITGMDMPKKDGSKALYPINPSNIMITELNLDDKKRIKNIPAKKEIPKEKGE